MKKIIILAAMLATGAVNAATVCGTPDSDGGPKIILVGATSDLSLPSFYKVTCITGYGDYGIPNDLPNYDRVCVTYTGTTTDSSNYIYTLQNCRWITAPVSASQKIIMSVAIPDANRVLPAHVQTIRTHTTKTAVANIVNTNISMCPKIIVHCVPVI